MRAQQRKPRETATISLRGPLTVGAPVDRLRDEILALLEEGVEEIRIDAVRVPYADASGLGLLAEYTRLAADIGTAVRIARARGKFRQELEMTGLIEGGRSRRSHRSAAGEDRTFRPRMKSYIRMLEPGVA